MAVRSTSTPYGYQVSKLRRWLARTPHPAKLRLEFDDGEEKFVVVGASRSRWRDAELAVQHAPRVEALDEQNQVLRVWEDDSAGSTVPRDNYGATTPAPPPPDPNSPAALAQLETLARLLHEAHSAGAERYVEACRMGFEQQGLLLRVLSERLQQLERAWHRIIMQQAQQATAEGEVDPHLGMIGTLLGAALPGMLPGFLTPPAPPNPGANGAGANGAK